MPGLNVKLVYVVLAHVSILVAYTLVSLGSCCEALASLSVPLNFLQKETKSIRDEQAEQFLGDLVMIDQAQARLNLHCPHWSVQPPPPGPTYI